MEENNINKSNPARDAKNNNEPVQNTSPTPNTESEPDSTASQNKTNTIIAILLLWFLYPLGLLFMWTKTKWSTHIKVLVTTLPALLVVVGFILAILYYSNNESALLLFKKSSPDYAPLDNMYSQPQAGSTFWVPYVNPMYFPLKYYDLGKVTIIIKTVGLIKEPSIELEGPYTDQLKMQIEKNKYSLTNITVINPGVFEASLPRGLKSGLYWVVVTSPSGEEHASPSLLTIGSKPNER